MFKNLSKKEMAELIAIAVLILAVVIVLICFSSAKKSEPVKEETKVPQEGEYSTVVREKEHFVEVEKVITASILEDGLQSMGFLVTQEYYFTEVVSNEKTESVLWGLFSSTAKYSVKYDGSVFAGVNFGLIKVSKKDDQVTVTVPAATIQTVNIDYNSFEMLMNEDGLWAHMTPDDYNESLKALEANAKTKATERGVIDKAQANAEKMIRQFITGLLGEEEVVVTINFKK